MNKPSDRFQRQKDLVPLQRLRDQTCAVIGVGAIGRQVAIQLAAMGAASIELIDFDLVEPTNLTTQGYLHEDLGKPKVQATAEQLLRIDHAIDVRMIEDRYRPQKQIGTSVFCCVDSIDARSKIWRSARQFSRFWCDGRMLGDAIRVLTAADDASRLHYQGTLFSPAEAQTGQCTSRSSIYAAGIAAGLMVHQFARWLRHLPTDADLSLNLLSSELVTA